MSDVYADIDYLKDLELYKAEKPYWCFLTPHDGFDPDRQRVDNLEFESRHNIKITDIRSIGKGNIGLESRGFEVLSHTTKIPELTTVNAVEAYKAETEQLLKERLGATFVRCYDLKLRKNIPFRRSQFDINDPLHMEGPARGAHVGMRLQIGPTCSTLDMNLADDVRQTRHMTLDLLSLVGSSQRENKTLI
ncbi:MAG: hypothetical protein M1813_007021 [Trichoglossum hirsutum]|nr:MAG: hypothetical protein M1813_007021 [Trichoglossum hirsutum]